VLTMYYLFNLAVGIERLIELVVSRRNAAWSIAQGGKEFGRGHYPAIPPVAGLADAARRGAQHRHALVVRSRGRGRGVVALPLVHSAWLTAIAFTTANAAVLTVRIRTEHRALGYT
jgi:methyltransferase